MAQHIEDPDSILPSALDSSSPDPLASPPRESRSGKDEETDNSEEGDGVESHNLGGSTWTPSLSRSVPPQRRVAVGVSKHGKPSSNPSIPTVDPLLNPNETKSTSSTSSSFKIPKLPIPVTSPRRNASTDDLKYEKKEKKKKKTGGVSPRKIRDFLRAHRGSHDSTSPRRASDTPSPNNKPLERTTSQASFLHSNTPTTPPTTPPLSSSTSSIQAFPGRTRRLTDRSMYHTLEKLRGAGPPVGDDKFFKRLSVIEEIYITEEAYVEDLSTIINVFLAPLRSKQLLSPELLAKVFSNVEMIYEINKDLLQRLSRRVGGLNATNGRRGDAQAPSISFHVGDIFQEMAGQFLAYKQYCINFKVSMETLAKVKKEPHLAAFLKSCYIRPEVHLLELSDFLVKPIQRLCQYPLLFKELLAITPPDSSDYAVLENTKNKIEEVATHINHSKKDAENMNKLLQIQKNLEGSLPKRLKFIVSPNRRFIFEGPLVKLPLRYESSVGKKSIARTRARPVQVYLFNDYMIYAKPKEESSENGEAVYRFKGLFPMKVTTVTTLDSVPPSMIARMRDKVESSEYALKWANGFLLQCADDKKSFLFFARSEAERSQWIEKIDSIHLEEKEERERGKEREREKEREKEKEKEREEERVKREWTEEIWSRVEEARLKREEKKREEERRKKMKRKDKADQEKRARKELERMVQRTLEMLAEERSERERLEKKLVEVEEREREKRRKDEEQRELLYKGMEERMKQAEEEREEERGRLKEMMQRMRKVEEEREEERGQVERMKQRMEEMESEWRRMKEEEAEKVKEEKKKKKKQQKEEEEEEEARKKKKKGMVESYKKQRTQYYKEMYLGELEWNQHLWTKLEPLRQELTNTLPS